MITLAKSEFWRCCLWYISPPQKNIASHASPPPFAVAQRMSMLFAGSASHALDPAQDIGKPGEIRSRTGADTALQVVPDAHPQIRPASRKEIESEKST